MSNQGDGAEKKIPPTPMPLPGMAYEPTRRDRLRPVELVGFSAILAVFTAIIVLAATREWWLTGISLAVSFIIVLVIVALLSMSFQPKADEVEELEEQDREDKGH
ncbi:MAG TPA: hypothetical protein VFQ96_00255 [Microbacteriaceae bacterium]|nr:hypothetical protein [Microbacteriaceae bacterium]